jgi:predicted RNA binding protein YcfA (HicA-like mRNA interferase family)
MPRVRELIRFLKKAGYLEKRQTGSHLILEQPTRRMLVIPVHSGDVPRGLFLRILKDAGLTEKDFFGG